MIEDELLARDKRIEKLQRADLLSKILNILLILLFGVFMILLGSYFHTFYHEMAHKVIYAEDGIESRIEITFFSMGGVTIPEENCNSERCRLSNNLNEIVGYISAAFIINFWLMLIFVLVYVEARRKK